MKISVRKIINLFQNLLTKNVCLLQFGYIFPLRVKTACHDVLQVVVAPVHPRPPLPLQQRLSDLLVLQGLRHWRTVSLATGGPQHQASLLSHFTLVTPR